MAIGTSDGQYYDDEYHMMVDRFSSTVPSLETESKPTQVAANVDSQSQQLEGVIGYLKGLFGFKEPTSTPIKQEPPGKAWPTSEDVSISNASERSYADPVEGYSRINEVSASQAIDWYNSAKDFKPNVRPIEPEEAENLYKQYIASERSAISKLGFSPGKIYLTPNADLTAAGAYRPDKDQIWYDSQYQATPIHESFHRGLKIMRDAGVMPDLPAWVNEESLVRALMLRHFADIEKGKGKLS